MIASSKAPGQVVGMFPLSAQQRRLWRLQQETGEARAQCAVRIEGPLDPGRLSDAVRLVVAREEILRTTFRFRSGLKVPFQTVIEDLEPAWREEEGSGWEEALRRMVEEPFDLENGPMLQASLLRLGEAEHVLLLGLPALCADGRTLANLVAEIGAAYESLRADREPEGEPLPYADFSEWQRELLQEEDAERGREHWRKQDPSSAPRIGLPGVLASGALPFDLSPGIAREVDRQARALGASPASLLLAVWQVLLWRLSGEPDVLVGEVFDGRKHEEFQDSLGLYARALPVRAKLSRSQRFSSLLQRVHDIRTEAVEWQEYAPIDEGSFPVAFELSQWPAPARFDGCAFSFLDLRASCETFEVKLSLSREGDRLRGELQGLGRLDALKLAHQYRTLLEGVLAAPSSPVGDLPLVGDAERHQLLRELNDSAAGFASGCTIHGRFEEQARRHPEAPAVIAQERVLGYGELDRLAGRIARLLRERGVGPEDRVGLFAERSPEMTAGLLGILKAGAAYVPLDPVFPPERLALMLEDGGVRVVVTQERLAGQVPAACETLLLDRLEPDAELAADADGGDLAYLLFTSGSTGRPKGVAVEHRQLLNYLDAVGERLDLPAGSSFATVSTIAADLGNTMVFSALCGGGPLHLIAPETASDPAALARYLRRHPVDCLKIVPSHLGALLMSADPEGVLPRRLLVLGGEAASWGLVERVRELAPGLRVLNHYGPTETTVGVTTRPALVPEEERHGASTVPIGRPLGNCAVHLVDAGFQPVPFGAVGELVVGGLQVARGYLKRPDLTAERFVPDPFGSTPGARLYRTGDLCRRLPDGTVEFLGRVDHQVKIRGFRVELGEIEAALGRYPSVWESVVVLQDGRLIAYLVPRRGQTIATAELRSFLSSRLPEYMVPAVLAVLDALPLTPNGKVDRAALPPPERADGRAARSVTPPRNPVEEKLAAIWSEVLNLPALGVEDNFFELGGDSILAIQVVARAGRAGIALSPKQLFAHQTIAQLALAAGTAPEVLADQGVVTGAVPLTPIQRWFFEQGFTAPHHWNQAALLEVDPGLAPRVLEEAVRRLIRHHDALRLRFESTPEGVRQSLAGDEERAFAAIDLSALPAERRSGAVEAAAAALQASLDLERGPIARMAAFHLGEGVPGRLMLVVHHLAVDGVSWRILLDDLETLCGGEPSLPAKTSSLRQWAERLVEHARSGAFDAELEHWSSASGTDPLPRDRADGANTVGSSRSLVSSFDAETTRALLQDVPAAYGTQINDILLAALARGFRRWTGSGSLRVDLEGHGREDLFEGIDVSRTVGWFTTHFPVRVELSADGDPGADLKRVKERLRHVPSRGIGYGLLRYLAEAEPLRGLPEPEVKLNYLGQLDGTLASARLFRPAPESSGPVRDPRCRRTHLLDVNGAVSNSELHLHWIYSEEVHLRPTVEELACAVAEELRALIAHCSERAALGIREHTPSDFPLAGLDEAELEALTRDLPSPRIEDIYPASPLQGSLLFHALSAPGSGVGFEQKSSLLRGDLDAGALAETWQRVVDRHAILRTAFAVDGAGRPFQVVLQNVRLPLETHDWRGLPAAEQEARFEEYLRAERRRGLDPARAPLMRVALIRMADDAHQLVWSYHHLLLDAWCRNLVLREVFLLYEAARAGRTPELPETRPYRDYIAWLQRQDPARAEAFWRGALAGFRTPTRLQVARPADPQGIEVEPRRLRFTPEETARLEAFARQQRLTLNALVQGAWALLLSRYAGSRDVVFGTTVSGRPPELPEVESILGMFINNLPVRVRISPGQLLADWLRDLQGLLLEAREHEWVSPLQIQEWSEVPLGQRLFESLVLFQNYPVDDASQEGLTGLEVASVRSRLETGYPLTLVAGPFQPLTLRIFHAPSRLDAEAAGRLAGHLRTLLLGFLDAAEAPVSALPMVSEEERRQLLAGATADPDLGTDVVRATPGQWLRRLESGWEGGPHVTALCPLDGLSHWLARELSSRAGLLFSMYDAGVPGRRAALRRILPGDAADAPRLLGLPLEGAGLRVLSLDGEPAPLGVTGEVHLDGQATGDLAAVLPGGELEMRGRLRRRAEVGDRVLDLWEIESELLRHPEVRAARVEPWRDGVGESQIVAYVVASRSGLPSVEPLRDRLAARLPRYAVPGLFVRLDALPLAPDGLVDPAALPAPDQAGTRLETPYVPPCDALELRLIQIWEELFDVRPIGVKDNFFALGGHSLLAVRLMARVRQELGKDLPLGTLLQEPTVAHLARAVRGAVEVPWSPLVPIQPEGSRPPLFCVHAVGGEVLCYMDLARGLGPDQPFYGLQSTAWSEGAEAIERMEDMAAAYLQALKQVQPRGPYRIAGWSFGGFVALEMAQQLHAAGESVALLAILDTNVLLEESSVDAAELILRFSRQRSYEAIERLRSQGSLERQLAYAVESGLMPPGLDLRTAMMYARAGEANSRAKEVYVPRPYPGRVTLFRATEGHVLNCPDPTLGWGDLAGGGLDIVDVPGRHTVMVERPYVQVLAKRLREVLDAIPDGSTNTDGRNE